MRSKLKHFFGIVGTLIASSALAMEGTPTNNAEGDVGTQPSQHVVTKTIEIRFDPSLFTAQPICATDPKLQKFYNSNKGMLKVIRDENPEDILVSHGSGKEFKISSGYKKIEWLQGDGTLVDVSSQVILRLTRPLANPFLSLFVPSSLGAQSQPSARVILGIRPNSGPINIKKDGGPTLDLFTSHFTGFVGHQTFPETDLLVCRSIPDTQDPQGTSPQIYAGWRPHKQLQGATMLTKEMMQGLVSPLNLVYDLKPFYRTHVCEVTGWIMDDQINGIEVRGKLQPTELMTSANVVVVLTKDIYGQFQFIQERKTAD